MPFIFCFGKGDALFLPGEVILRPNARKRARRHKCGGSHFLCGPCALVRGMISAELAQYVQDAKFTLVAPLTEEQAKLWKPPANRQRRIVQASRGSAPRRKTHLPRSH